MPTRRDTLAYVGSIFATGAVTGGGGYVLGTRNSETKESRTPSTSTPTSTPTETPTETPEPTPTETSTPETATPTPTPEPTAACNSQFDCEIYKKAGEIGKRVRKSTVFIQVKLGQYATSQGTGWVYDANHIITNQHVIEGANEIYCWTLDGKKLDVTVTNTSSDPDLAVLKTSDDLPSALPIGSTDSLSKGDALVQVGHPGDVGNWIVTLGRFRNRIRDRDLSSSVPGSEGVSGAATLTMDGEVVGLTYGGTSLEAVMPGERPEPGSSTVHESLEENTIAFHEPIEDVTSNLSSWI